MNLTLLFFAGLLAGAMNAVAGGGSFITFPAFLYAGVPPVTANASSTVALFPGSMAGAWEYRKYLQPFPGVSFTSMIICTFLGGCTGALLLLYTPSTSFNQLVPWLLLTGTFSFAFGKRAGNWLSQRVRIGSALVLVSQFFLGIYGGYFGGAVGIMMMAVWSLFGMNDIKVVNANKNLFVGIANAIAVIIFILAGKVAWLETGTMLVATIIGAYLGAHYTKGMNPVKLRQGIVIFNFVITAIFFIKIYS